MAAALQHAAVDLALGSGCMPSLIPVLQIFAVMLLVTCPCSEAYRPKL